MKYGRIDEDIARLKEQIEQLEILKNYSCFSCKDMYCMHANTGHDDCCQSHSEWFYDEIKKKIGVVK